MLEVPTMGAQVHHERSRLGRSESADGGSDEGNNEPGKKPEDLL